MCKFDVLKSSKMPKAYRVGFQNFYGRDFTVTPDVLIPRPETEQMIDMVLGLAGHAYLPGMKPPERKLPENPVILDVGTGSGCIAVTLALELPEAEVFASDISEKALKIAQKNANQHGAPINIIISHLLKNVNMWSDLGRDAWQSKVMTAARPDVVVANLPYVDPEWSWLDKETLAYEPELALYAENHGLALIEELIMESSERQIPRLILEADPCQHAKITKFATKYSYRLEKTMGFIVSYIFDLKQ